MGEKHTDKKWGIILEIDDVQKSKSVEKCYAINARQSEACWEVFHAGNQKIFSTNGK